MSTKDLVSKLLTNKSVTPTQYRVAVIAAEIADNGKAISPAEIRQKIQLSNSYTHKVLVGLIELGVLVKAPKRKGHYHFNPQDLWFSKESESQPSKKTLNAAANGGLLNEVKVLQELTKELLGKLNQRN